MPIWLCPWKVQNTGRQAVLSGQVSREEGACAVDSCLLRLAFMCTSATGTGMPEFNMLHLWLCLVAMFNKLTREKDSGSGCLVHHIALCTIENCFLLLSHATDEFWQFSIFKPHHGSMQKVALRSPGGLGSINLRDTEHDKMWMNWQLHEFEILEIRLCNGIKSKLIQKYFFTFLIKI